MATEAQIRANNKYRKKAYDRLEITLPKGRKSEIQDAADTAGESINGYVTKAVDERMERGTTKEAE